MSDEEALRAIDLRDDPNAPIIYCDGCAGGGSGPPGVTTLVFAARLFDHSVTPSRCYSKVVLRLVMPTDALQQTVEFINSAALAEHQPPSDTRSVRNLQ
jgi:hypothetical protein